MKVKIACWMVAILLGSIGGWLMMQHGVPWQAMIGLALILWGNNLSQSKVD